MSIGCGGSIVGRVALPIDQASATNDKSSQTPGSRLSGSIS